MLNFALAREPESKYHKR